LHVYCADCIKLNTDAKYTSVTLTKFVSTFRFGSHTVFQSDNFFLDTHGRVQTLETEPVSKPWFEIFRVGSAVWHPSFDKRRFGVFRLNIFVLHI
jgi:hypothetical protein